MIEPADLVARVEKQPELQGDDTSERFNGYGVMAAPFRSGHLLAMRRFPASSVGGPYTSVWYRSPGGEWTFWSDRPPLEACPRYFGSAIAHALVAPIEVEWTGPRRFEVRVPSASLIWSLELEPTPVTQALNAIGSAMPEALWHSPETMAAMGWVAGHLLHAGKLGLSGHVPNGQSFIANPIRVWVIRQSRATLGEENFGELGPLPEQTRLGDFWIPQRGLFAIGRAFFEPTDAARHRLVTEASSPQQEARG